MQPREAAHKWPGGGSPGAINTANPNVGAERNHPSRPQVPHPQWPPPSHSRQPHSLTGRRRGVEREPAASVLNIVEESTPAPHRHHAHAHPSRHQRRPYRHHVADELPTCRAPRRSDRGRDERNEFFHWHPLIERRTPPLGAKQSSLIERDQITQTLTLLRF